MTEFNFKIEPEQVKAMLAEALGATITPEVRDKLVQGAVHDLMKGGWQQQSELQRIFSMGASDVARVIFEEEFNRPERREQIREVVVEAFDKAFKDQDSRDKLIEKLASGIGAALSGGGY